MFKIKELPNGLKIIVSEMPTMSSVAIGIGIGLGGRYENEKTAGISHYIEHMVFKGTASRTCQQIKEEIEGLGGYLNAFTSKEQTCYYSKIIGEEYKQALKVLSDLVINPKFSEKDINQERGVILEEIKMYLDLPMHFVHDVLDTVMWPNHPLGLYLTGTEETVNSFNRNDFINFKDNYYAPNNIVVSCAGNIKFDEIVESVSNLFSDLDKKQKKEFTPIAETEKKSNVKIINKQTEQTHIAIGINAYSRHHKNKYAMGVLNIILGGNMSSRLFKEIREERGLAYEIKTSTSKYDDTGVFEISAGTEPKKCSQALEVILNELNKIKKENVSSDELIRAKKYLTGNFSMSLEKTAERMLWLEESILNKKDKIETSEEILNNINKVTIDDINRAANEIFQNKGLHLAIIGPVDEPDKIKNNFSL